MKKIEPTDANLKFRSFLIEGVEEYITDCDLFFNEQTGFRIEYNGKPIGYEVIYIMPYVTKSSNMITDRFLRMIIKHNIRDKLALFVFNVAREQHILLVKLTASNTDFLLGALDE